MHAHRWQNYVIGCFHHSGTNHFDPKSNVCWELLWLGIAMLGISDDHDDDDDDDYDDDNDDDEDDYN